jgi:NAD+ diphosphatase
MAVEMKHCMQCGALLEEKYLESEGKNIPWCPDCRDYRFPVFNAGVSMIITNVSRDKLLLIRQYGEPGLVFVAGYVDKGETAEDAVRREVREELGMTAEHLRFHLSRWYAPSETLMLHYSCTVPEKTARPNAEVEAWEWVPVEHVRARLAPGLATELYVDFLSP